jgi:hypothetical protein
LRTKSVVVEPFKTRHDYIDQAAGGGIRSGKRIGYQFGESFGTRLLTGTIAVVQKLTKHISRIAAEYAIQVEH